jgi:hypothetical protein
MTYVEIKSRVGADGILTVTLPLGPEEANREVRVIVKPAGNRQSTVPPIPEEWRTFVKRMAGCISDPTFQRPDQGQYELRGEAFP